MKDSKPQKTNKKIKNAYKNSLSVYDEILMGRTWWSRLYLNIFWGGISDEYIADRLLSRIPAQFAGSILDVPVGTGIFTAKHYKRIKDARITGVDYSEDMLEKCRILMQKHSVSIDLINGDVGNLEFEDQYFDMVVSMNGFHVFPDKEKAYDNCSRVLKKGGLLYGCFYVKDELKNADFLVKHILAPKGWFSPPFETKESLVKRLEQDFEVVWFRVDGAIASFECKKKRV